MISFRRKPQLFPCRTVYSKVHSSAHKFDLNDLLFFYKAINNLVPISLPVRSSQSTIHSSGLLSKSFFYRTHLLSNYLSTLATTSSIKKIFTGKLLPTTTTGFSQVKSHMQSARYGVFCYLNSSVYSLAIRRTQPISDSQLIGNKSPPSAPLSIVFERVSWKAQTIVYLHFQLKCRILAEKFA